MPLNSVDETAIELEHFGTQREDSLKSSVTRAGIVDRDATSGLAYSIKRCIQLLLAFDAVVLCELQHQPGCMGAHSHVEDVDTVQEGAGRHVDREVGIFGDARQ